MVQEELYVTMALSSQDGKTVPMAVKVGDKVLVPEYGGTKLTFDEEVR